MSKQQIEIPHTLPVAEVRSRLAAASGKLEERYGARCTWQGEHELKVTRSGLDASLRIEEARVRIDLELGFLMRPFRDKITNGITRELTSVLAAPAPAA